MVDNRLLSDIERLFCLSSAVIKRFVLCLETDVLNLSDNVETLGLRYWTI